MTRSTQEVALADIEYLHDIFKFFGNPQSPNWFLGLEEGDHPNKNESADNFIQGLIRKSKMYEKQTPMSLRDMCGGGTHRYLPTIDGSDNKDISNLKYQTTWGGYIKLLLSIYPAANGNTEKWTLTDVKRYQKFHLGALNPDGNIPTSCLMELYPMARKGRGSDHWPYEELSNREGLSFFQSSKDYLKYATKRRAGALIDAVSKYNPDFVFCFGSDCKHSLLPLLKSDGFSLKVNAKNKTIKVPVVDSGSTKFVFSRHPACGISNSYWIDLGEQLAESRDHTVVRGEI